MFDFIGEDAEQMVLDPAPVVQVIAQVRFNAQSALGTHQGAALLQDRIVDRYPRLLTEQQAVITAGPTGVTSTPAQQWRLSDLAGAWSVVVSTEQLTLETTSYLDWNDLSGRLAEVMQALGAVTAPRVRERLGLRYVNHVPDDGQAFTSRVRSELLGTSAVDAWRPHLWAAFSQTILTDENVQLALRYGTGPQVTPDEAAFIVDIDCSQEGPASFDSAEVLRYFDEFNRAVYRCFCWCVAEDYRQSVRA